MNRRTIALATALSTALAAAAWAQDQTPAQNDTAPAPAGLATQVAPPPIPPPPPEPTTLSPVIWTENPDVVQRFAVDSDQARHMVNSALLKLTSAQDIGTAWTRLGITPQDIVGIKITTMGGPILSTHRPI